MPLPLIMGALSLVTEFAPSLIRHFAGEKAGEVAETVTTAVKQLTGHDIGTSDGLQAAQKAFKDEPQLLLQFQQSMAQTELELEKAYLADRKDARARDTAMTKAGYHNYRADIMLALAFGALIFIVWQINSKPEIKAGVLAIFNMSVGALLKMIGDGFAFEFGSSRGSKEKDKQL